MYFSKVTLKPNANTSQLADQLCQNTYKEHQILWKLFDAEPSVKRDFIYRYEPHNNIPGYYIVSKRKPVDTATLWKIETKHYAPVLTTGQRFFFLLRVNPAITKDGRRHDVVMHLKYHQYPDKNTRPNLQSIIEEAGTKWLQHRAEHAGFSFDDSAVCIDSYQPHVSGKKRGKEIRYSTMDFRGVLTVTNPASFENTLMQGIGKARAFGCGLMLIRRAG